MFVSNTVTSATPFLRNLSRLLILAAWVQCQNTSFQIFGPKGVLISECVSPLPPMFASRGLEHCLDEASARPTALRSSWMSAVSSQLPHQQPTDNNSEPSASSSYYMRGSNQVLALRALELTSGVQSINQVTLLSIACILKRSIWPGVRPGISCDCQPSTANCTTADDCSLNSNTVESGREVTTLRREKITLISHYTCYMRWEVLI